MQRAKTSFLFSDGREVVVEESTWETGDKKTAIEERSRAEKAKLNGTGDPVYFYFIEAFYSFLASCSSGPVPDAQEALSLSDQDLDGWYLSLVEVNPESFLPVDYSKKGKVEFRDGSSLEIISSYLPSVTMRRARLQEEALKREPDRENPKDIFSFYLYPILAACSIGEILSPDEIRSTWPQTEIYKWRDAVEEINPQWFKSSEELQAQTLAQAETIEKKKEKRPRRLRAS